MVIKSVDFMILRKHEIILVLKKKFIVGLPDGAVVKTLSF